MYSIKRILVTVGRIVQVMDVSEDKVSDLLDAYSSIKIILEHPDLDVDVSGELHDNQFMADYAGTIKQLIQTNQITKLNLLPYEGQEGEQVIYKTDLWERDFDVEPADVLGLMSGESEVSLLPDLKLNNGFINATELAKTHMLSVNGLIHPLVADSTGVYAIGANTNCREAGELEMSLIEFRNVGDMNLVSLGCDSRIQIHQNQDLHQNGIYIKLDPAYKDKVIGLVLLGHLHLIDGTYKHFDQDIIHISLKDLDLETKIINHHAKLGMKNVENYLKGGLGRVDLRNPSLINYVLNNRSSFMFTLDTDVLYRLERPLSDEGLPCVYSSPEGHTGILQYADALMADYRQEYQDGLYCFQVPRRPSTETLVKTTDYAAQQSSVRGRRPQHTDSLPQLKAIHFLKSI